MAEWCILLTAAQRSRPHATPATQTGRHIRQAWPSSEACRARIDWWLGHAVHLVVRAEQGEGEDSKVLAKALAKELPNFMHPKQFHWKSAMPLNPNGKIDRTALLREIAA